MVKVDPWSNSALLKQAPTKTFTVELNKLLLNNKIEELHVWNYIRITLCLLTEIQNKNVYPLIALKKKRKYKKLSLSC